VTADAAASYSAEYEVAPSPPVEKQAEPPPVVNPAVAPTVKLKQQPPRRTHAGVARFVFAGSEPGASFVCKLDGRPSQACHSPKVYRRLEPGAHVFRVYATVPAPGGQLRGPAAARHWNVLAAGKARG
jgi:hypothetical protein